MSKGQGLSLNTIVVAAIVIVVLVVLVAIFTGALGDFVPSLLSGSEKMCSGSGFETPTQAAGCSDGYKQVFGKFAEGEVADGRICCQLPTQGGGGGLEGPQPQPSQCTSKYPASLLGPCTANNIPCESGYSPDTSNSCGQGHRCCLQSG